MNPVASEQQMTETPRAASPRWRAGEIGVLIAILLVSIAMRAQAMFQPFVDGFSWRQTSMAMMADNFYRTSWNIFLPEVSWTGPGTSYQGREFQTVTYLTALLYNVFGQHDWVARGVRIAFSVWGTLAFYLLLRRLWDVPRAMTGSAVYAVMPGAVLVDRSFLPIRPCCRLWSRVPGC